MIKEDHKLVISGPYRAVRHPIYTGILLGLLGNSIGDAELRDLLVLLLALLVFGLKVRVEETLLLRQFPEVYADYRKRTKTLIPFIV